MKEIEIAFTICSNNYLAQAFTLVDSIHEFNSNFHSFICVVDKKSSLLDYPSKYNFIFLSELFEENEINYFSSNSNIIEFNTMFKPSFLKYLIFRFPKTANFFYFDPDIKIFSSLSYLSEVLKFSSIILTPHFTEPIKIDNLIPGENIATNYGMYNLGFIGVNSKFDSALAMIEWWESRCLTNCKIDLSNGYFVDQLFINHVPIFYEGVNVLLHKGLNVAPWNLHERELVQRNSELFIKNGDKLIFFHFSSFNVLKNHKFSSIYNRFESSKNSIISDLFFNYSVNVLSNGYHKYYSQICLYDLRKEKSIFLKYLHKLKKITYLK
jgi:hypothetical protein